MSRYRASFIHLLISTLLVGSVLAIVFLAWYPGPLFEIAGAASVVRVLIGVDLVVGPLLTLIIYKEDKWGLKFDLCAIAVLQIIALLYGSYLLYDEKPHYLVFVVDRLEFTAEKQVDTSAIRFDTSQVKQFAGLRQVFARPPEDPDEYQRYLTSVMDDGLPDLDGRGEYWEPWSAGADVIRSKIKPLNEIEPGSPREQQNLQQAIESYAAAHPNLGVLPIGSIEENKGMLLDRDTLEVLDVLNVNPWILKDAQ